VIISRTPFRVSFFGGGTDYPAWYRRHGGAVLAATIDKYCYVSCRHLPPFFEHSIRLVYSKIENCHSVDEIAHPVIREAVRFLQIERELEIHHDADLPARCGMGSSSSFTVGLLHALYALKGQMPSKRQLMLESIDIEQERLGETVGSQDQASAAHGGLNHIAFLPEGDIAIRPVTVSPARRREFDRNLMLFYTGIMRTASDVAKSYVEDIEARKSQLRVMANLVDEGLSILTGGGDIDAFGELLHETWQLKRGLSKLTTNDEVDTIYAAARKAGALGGKLTGAGGGGFMLLFVPPARQDEVKDALRHLIHVPFRVENSGSQIIFFDSEVDYSGEEAQRAGGPRQVFRELSEVQGSRGETT
jgi:D-glycero-alpha-D-manno-heptose-7-phosphate kinase